MPDIDLKADLLAFTTVIEEFTKKQWLSPGSQEKIRIAACKLRNDNLSAWNELGTRLSRNEGILKGNVDTLAGFLESLSETEELGDKRAEATALHTALVALSFPVQCLLAVSDPVSEVVKQFAPIAGLMDTLKSDSELAKQPSNTKASLTTQLSLIHDSLYSIDVMVAGGVGHIRGAGKVFGDIEVFLLSLSDDTVQDRDALGVMREFTSRRAKRFTEVDNRITTMQLAELTKRLITANGSLRSDIDALNAFIDGLKTFAAVVGILAQIVQMAP